MKRKISIVQKTVSTPSPVPKRTVPVQNTTTARRTPTVASNAPVVIDPLKSNIKDFFLKKADKIKFTNAEPITKSSIEKSTSVNFVKGNAEPFENLIKITNDKPEIVALTDFLPCYRDDGSLNETGNLFQAKQDALLISCVDCLKNILIEIENQKPLENTGELTIKNYINDTTNELYAFCSTIEKGISSLLFAMEDTKKSFDIKRNLDNEISQINSIPEDLKNYASLEEMTNATRGVWTNWTNTKLWLQMCKEYHNALRYGIWRSSNDLLISDVASTDETILSPYKLYTPQDTENKLKFNTSQIILSRYYDAGIVVTSNTLFETVKNQLLKIFTTDSILNVNMRDLIGDDEAQKSKNIAKLSTLISKELRYSTEIRKLKYSNSPILTTFNYPLVNLDSPNNTTFWSHVIGQTGADITEIPENPTSNTLVNISQRQESLNTETETFEILSFENVYINDDITSTNQTLARDATLTPGTFFYVDNTLNENSLFDVTTTTSYRNSVKDSLNALKSLCTTETSQGTNSIEFLFDKNIVPRNFQEIIRNPQPISYELNFTEENLTNILRNPLMLIRFIELKLLNERYLTRFDRLPKIADNKDLSPLLISFALENIDTRVKDKHLLSLIYMYVLTKVNIYTKESQGLQNDNNLPLVIELIKKYLIEYYENNNKINIEDSSTVSLNIENSITSDSLTSLNEIAKILASINKEFTKIDPRNPESTYVANPFSVNTTDVQKSFYSDIQKESILTLIFFLCCTMIHEANPQAIIDVKNEGSARATSSSVYKLKIKNVREFVDRVDDVATIIGEKKLNIYRYDSIIEQTEKLVWNETVDIKRMSAWFVNYLTALENKLSSFINGITSGQYQTNYYEPISLLLNGDNVLTTKVFTLEQLNLIKSKLSYMLTRLSPEYNSGLRTIAPYFISFDKEDSKIINGCLPLEDVHLVAWNFFLKDYLKQEEFFESIASNKKIISVGLPHKIYRRLQKFTNASTLENSASQTNLISINVYLKDHLRPQLIHQPQKFIFDLNKFTIRTLNYYLDSAIGTAKKLDDVDARGGEIDEKEFEYLKFLPFFNLNGFQEIQNIRADDAHDLLDTIENEYAKFQTYLSTQQFEQLRKNHIKNFFLEEYLRFVTSYSLDETSFSNYAGNIQRLDNELIFAVTPQTQGALEYLKNTIFTSSENIKRSLISPKKFDRVFHIMIDPDDFEINIEKTNEISSSTIEYFKNAGVIAQIPDTNNYKRVATQRASAEFNSYVVELEIIA
jgi:hypothetical protein